MSMKIPKKRSILFFPGIFIERSKIEEVISNYENEHFNKQLTIINGSDTPNDMYDKIPNEFRNKETWMKSTNLLCSTCCQVIIGPPIPLPSYITHDEYSNECVYKGITSLHHSWTCASMYNTLFKDNNNTGYFALKHLHQKWKELSLLSEIPNGIPFTDKQQFGGKLTEKQWDDMNEYYIKDSIAKSKLYLI